MPICHVSDTAHWVATYRALESERPDALFHDPFARRMAGPRGEAIVREIPLGESMAWAMVVRTAVMDELILACVAQGAAGVVNLGAGLDTRAFRLALPAALHWLDVDLPEMVAHRRECLDGTAPACIHQHMAAHLDDPAEVSAVLAVARKSHGPLLVVSEGLLIYFEPAQVRRLAQQLHAEPAVRWWLTDLIAPQLLALIGPRWPSNEAAASAPFRFAPQDSSKFFAPQGWSERAFHSTLDDSLRLGRSPPLARWWSSFGMPWWPGPRETLRRMSGIAWLQAGPGPADCSFGSARG